MRFGKIRNKIVSILLAAAVTGSLFTLLPASAFAAEAATSLTENTTALSEGDYTALQDMTIHSRIQCSGDVHLTLAEGVTLTVPKGIHVTGSASLTIDGSGTLMINAAENTAGIGGDADESLSSLTVSGGTVKVAGGSHAAGIGGGKNGFGGKVAVSGGNVTANGGEGGAGIGSGALLESNGDSDEGDGVYISGGTVTATGGNGAAGIGEDYVTPVTEGNMESAVSITGGTVTAYANQLTPEVEPTAAERNKQDIGGDSCKISITGGAVQASGGGISSENDVNLGWTNMGDSFHFYIINATVRLQKELMNNQNHQERFSPGTYSAQGAMKNPLEGKTLVPPFTEWLSMVPYIDENGSERYAEKAVPVNTEQTEFVGGWYAVKEAVDGPATTTVNHRITCTGNVSLILCDFNTLSLPAGITVAEGASLTVYCQRIGNGGLRCAGSVAAGNAAIGSEQAQNSGKITIVGGKITAAGGQNGAAIGGGRNSFGGSVRISGGNVTALGAIGGEQAAVSLSWTNAANSIFAESYSGASVTLEKNFHNQDNLREIFRAGAASTEQIGGKTIVPDDSPQYTVTIDQNMRNGTVTSSCAAAEEGETVSLTIKPDLYYHLKSISVQPLGDAAVSGSGNIRTFAMPASDVLVTAEFERDSVLVGYTLSLDGDIGVNFYMELSRELADSKTAYIEFRIPAVEPQPVSRVYVNPQEDASLPYAGQKSVNGKTCYVFKCRTAAKEMTSEIHARLYDPATEWSGETYTYSVKEYAAYLLAHTADDPAFAAAEPLVRSLVRYGAYAQLHFDRNADDLADDGLLSDEEKDVSSVQPEMLSDKLRYQNHLTTPNLVKFCGSTLSMKSETSLSLYFRSDQPLTFACETNTVDTVANGDYQVVRIRNIPSDKAQEAYTVFVKRNGESVGSVTYSPMDYCYQVLTADDTVADTALKNVVRAFYLYTEAARSYFSQRGGNGN